MTQKRNVEEKLPKIENEIIQFLHCKKCVSETYTKNVSPREYVNNEFGWTEKGLQIWCVRHNMNVVHYDFLGQQVGIV